MALDLRNRQPSRFTVNLTLSTTSGTMTLVRLPKWVGTVTVRPRTDAIKLIDGDLAADAIDIGSRAYKSVDANDDRVTVYRSSPTRPDWENWPPQFSIASTTTSGTVVEIEVERW